MNDSEHNQKKNIHLTGRERSGRSFIMAFILAEQTVARLRSPAFPCTSLICNAAPAAPSSPQAPAPQGSQWLQPALGQEPAERGTAWPKPPVKRSCANKINSCCALILSLFLCLPGRSGFTGREGEAAGKHLLNKHQAVFGCASSMHPRGGQENLWLQCTF